MAEKDLLGTTIKIKKEHLKAVKASAKSNRDIGFLINQLSQGMRKNNDDFWKLLYELYPETKDYDISIDHETMEIHIIKSKKWGGYNR